MLIINMEKFMVIIVIKVLFDTNAYAWSKSLVGIPAACQ